MIVAVFFFPLLFPYHSSTYLNFPISLKVLAHLIFQVFHEFSARRFCLPAWLMVKSRQYVELSLFVPRGRLFSIGQELPIASVVDKRLSLLSAVVLNYSLSFRFSDGKKAYPAKRSPPVLPLGHE